MNKKQDLTAEQKHILFEEGTEAPGSSSLNNEKREGSYYCVRNVGQNYLILKQNMKVDQAGHRFFQSLPDVFETKTDHHLGYARTEYHCKKCGGHHGHIFEDGPQPTGKRYCNNGIMLGF